MLAAGCQPESVAEWAQPQLANFQRPERWLRLPEDIGDGGIKLASAAGAMAAGAAALTSAQR